MRPHDIVVLLKIISFGQDNWLGKDISSSLFISPSEVSESLNRSMIARLLSPDKRKVMKNALLKFIENGLSYVFPAELGAIQKGIATAHSAPVLEEFFSSSEAYVWPSTSGKVKGHSVPPLYPGQVQAALLDDQLYGMLALIDAVRIGRVRECEKAMELLRLYFK